MRKGIEQTSHGSHPPLMSCQGSIFIQRQGSEVVSRPLGDEVFWFDLAYVLLSSQRQEEGGVHTIKEQSEAFCICMRASVFDMK